MKLQMKYVLKIMHETVCVFWIYQHDYNAMYKC
jgi:hypothetical protein